MWLRRLLCDFLQMSDALHPTNVYTSHPWTHKNQGGNYLQNGVRVTPIWSLPLWTIGGNVSCNLKLSNPTLRTFTNCGKTHSLMSPPNTASWHAIFNAQKRGTKAVKCAAIIWGILMRLSHCTSGGSLRIGESEFSRDVSSYARNYQRLIAFLLLYRRQSE